MARKNHNTETPRHTCGECEYGIEYTSVHNKSVDGKTICVKCKHSVYARLKSEAACCKFKQKQQFKQ